MAKMAIFLAMMLLVAAGVAYVDRSAVSRVEAKNLRHAMAVQRKSRAATERLSAEAAAKHAKDRAAADRRIADLRASADAHRRAAAAARKGGKPSPYCRPGCRIK